MTHQLQYAIFPHQGEFAVAHLGYCRAPDMEKFQGFQTAWVLDQLCPTHALAVEAMERLKTQNKARIATELADQLACARRR